MPQTVSRLVVTGSIVRTIVRGKAVWKSAENSAMRERCPLSGLDVCAGLNCRAFVPTTHSHRRDLRLALAG